MKAELTIPFTLPNLNDYISAERTNRFKAAKMKHDAEEGVGWFIRSQSLPRFDKPCFIEYRWFEKNKRRDLDNISSFGRKVIQDALVRNGVLANDGWANIVGFSDSFAVDKERPRIEVTIMEVEIQNA